MLLGLLYPFRTDDSDVQESPTEDQRCAQYVHHAAEDGCRKVVVLASNECGGAGGGSEPEERVNEEADVEVELRQNCIL